MKKFSLLIIAYALFINAHAQRVVDDSAVSVPHVAL